MNGCVHRTEDNKCTYYSHGDTVSWCDLENGCDAVIPSNYDKIHAFTEEELARAIVDSDCLQDACPCDVKICDNYLDGCFIAWLKWLKEGSEREVFQMSVQDL